ncbi:MAG TPA: response regulator [Rhodanobacteraceae bacterium]|nr:response regulator [Rhodanobacteraceae bacterium]
MLLVEDEPMLRELAADTLADAGYHVIEASDGTGAEDILQSAAPIDLLLSDIRLPGPDGYELAATGCALRPELKVILMTGYAPTPLPTQLHGLVHDVLRKPFAIDSLPEVIAAALAPA